MSTEYLDAVVVGAGQAGLSVSHYLNRLGVDHAVLERDRVGESWRSARWDSFTLVTPAWMTRLPGVDPALPGDSFATRDQTVSLLEDLARPLPVRTGVDVTAVGHHPAGGYLVRTNRGDLHARTVVAAGGGLRTARIPALADQLPATVEQMHSCAYRNPAQPREGGVLVVGSGQSGAQIAEELARAGRRVFLATSRVPRLPRRYRGRDAHDWLAELGQHDRTVDQVPDPRQRNAPHPMLSGGRGGHTLALQQLARDGVDLLGRLVRAEGQELVFDGSLRENISFADQAAEEFRRSVDAHVRLMGLPAPAPEPDPAERPQPDLTCTPRVLDAAQVGTVIWATGFGPDTAWLDVPVLGQDGTVMQIGGLTGAPGLYAVGYPWLTHRGSGILYGVAADALRVARHLAATLRADGANRGPAAPANLAAC
jgi:putative flavoprotein involved in K+ transport